MKSSEAHLICNLKTMRLANGLSQGQLAELIGVKRQAIYDIESGKYTPNTAVALRLAKLLHCTVEDLFSDEAGAAIDATLVEEVHAPGTRVAMARIHGKLLAYPLTGKRLLLLEGFEPADGIMDTGSNSARLLCPPDRLDQSVILYGCDPGFSLLAMHTMREVPHSRIHCLFASSRSALEHLAAGRAHLAGTHMHSKGQEDGNLTLVREVLPGVSLVVVAFAHVEEGIMVSPGNPLGLSSIADLGDCRARIINRKQGAALRNLLDDQLIQYGISSTNVLGYELEANTHHESALNVLYGKADAALGFKAFAHTYGLDFIPLVTVRCDLVIPKEFFVLPEVGHLMSTLQTRKMREDLQSLPGYDSKDTGSVVAEL